jgi:subfamily B ATP-binding cassette protein HlyB/CyaB
MAPGKDEGNGALPLEAAVWLLSSFCTLHRKPFDANLFARQHPLPIAPETFSQAAEELGLSCQWKTATRRILERARLPAAISSETGWLLLLNLDDERALVLERGAAAPRELSRPELDALLRPPAGKGIVGHRKSSSLLLECQPSTPAIADPDGVSAPQGKFSLRWFLPELLKHRRIWRDVLTASLALQLMALALPLFTQVIIDKVIVHRTESTLIALGIGMAVFMTFTAGLTWVRQYLILHTGNRVDAVLGSSVFSHLFKLPPLYFQHRPTGVISARLQGVETIREFIASAAVTLILDLPFLLIFAAIMFWYSVKLTLIVLAIVAVIGGLSLLVAPLFQKRLNEQFLRGAANQAFVTEYIAGLETVKSLQLEPQLNHRYRDLLSSYLGASLSTRQLANTYNTWAGTLEQMMNLLILTLGAWTVMTSTAFTVGMLVAFQMFAARISQPVLRLVGLWQQWQQTKLAIVRLGDVMNAPAEPYSLVPSRATASGAGGMSFEGLSFRYGEHLPYLYENLTSSVAPGQLIALMGPSGAGKSTLAKLLQGFYLPTQGAIRVDGIDIRHLSANELRAYFGVVPQETVLFSGTVLDNLKLANPFATFEQIVAACKMAEIHSVIESLPQGYQTAIGERGAGLSGGQRQRLAIARALLKGPKILIFDEATSSLDLLTAEQIARTVNSLKGRVTILFIAHALPRGLQIDHTIRIGEKLAVVPQESGATQSL